MPVKPQETIFGGKMPMTWKKESVIMALCFLYGGFAIIASAIIIAGDAFPQASPMRFWDSNEHFDANRAVTITIQAGASNGAALRERPALQRLERPGPPFRPNTEFMAVVFASGILSIAAGATIFGLTREKEVRAVKRDMANNLLMPDERKVMETLAKSGYEIMQSKVSKESGLSKVQVHRAVKRLESRGVLRKHRYGLTNKVILEKEFR